MLVLLLIYSILVVVRLSRPLIFLDSHALFLLNSTIDFIKRVLAFLLGPGWPYALVRMNGPNALVVKVIWCSEAEIGCLSI